MEEIIKINIFEQEQIEEIIESDEIETPFKSFYINNENKIYFLEENDLDKKCYMISIKFLSKNNEIDKTKLKIKIVEEETLILFKNCVNNTEVETMEINKEKTLSNVSIEIIKNKIEELLVNSEESDIKVKNIISYLKGKELLWYIKKNKLKDTIYEFLRINEKELDNVKREKFYIFKNIYWFLENEFADKKDKKTYTPDDIGLFISNVVKEFEDIDKLIVYDPFSGSGNLMLQLFSNENNKIKGIILNDNSYNLEGILENNLFEFIRTFGITASKDKLLLDKNFNKDTILPILTTGDGCGTSIKTEPNVLITNPDFIDKNYSNILNKIGFIKEIQNEKTTEVRKETSFEVTIINFKTQKLFLQVASNLYINILKAKNNIQQFKYCIFLSNKIVKEFENDSVNYDLYTICEEDLNVFQSDNNMFENKKLKIKNNISLNYIKDNAFNEDEIIKKIQFIKDNDLLLKNKDNFLIENTLYYKNNGSYNNKSYSITKIEEKEEKKYNLSNNRLICIINNTINDNILKIDNKPNLIEIKKIYSDLHSSLF